MLSHIQKNFKLIFYDIKSFLLIRYNNYLHRDIIFKNNNKKEVLLLYKHLLKELPKMQITYFDKIRVYEEIKFNFVEGSRETDFETICYLKNVCYEIIEKVNKGVYPPFPKFRA